MASTEVPAANRLANRQAHRQANRRSAPVIFVLEPFGGSIRRNNPSLPFIFPDDAAVTRGDGVFETLLISGGAPANLDRHLARFRASARLLDMPEPEPEYWRRATAEAVAAWNDEGGEGQDAKCVWTYTRGRASTGYPSAWLVITPVDEATLSQRAAGVAVMTTPRGYTVDADRSSAPWLTIGAKTLNYAANMAALRYARSQGFDDVVFVSGERVLEGATSTVVIAKKGQRLRTPVTGGEVLPGTTQAALFEYAEQKGWRCKERELTVADLLAAESVWLVSSVRVAARVTRIDGAVLPAPGNEAEIRKLITKALKR